MMDNPQGGNTIVVQGGSTAIPLLGGIVDGIGDALAGLLKILTCHMVTTTTVTCNDKGVVQKIETKTECVPG